jgi:3'-5' exoribonuclease
MSKSKPALVRLAELTPGQGGDFFVFLAEKNPGATRDGKPFFTCRFRDSSRVATAMIWSDTPWYPACDKEWQAGGFFKVRGQYQEHPTYGPQIEIQNIRAVNDEDKGAGFDPLDFVERTRFDVEAMFQELWSLAETHIADIPLRRLVLTLLERNSRQLKRIPATTRHFFPFAGGLLEHILSVTHTCIHLADKYAGHYDDLDPPINRDLVIAGAILHDIGRCAELNDNVVKPERTVPGHLLGHLLLGRDMVREAAKELGDVDAELVGLLEHLIVSHLNHPEWGSARLPMRPEVLIVHHADDLDAKVEMFARCLLRDKEPGPITARDPVLGKQLYKGRRGPAEDQP